MKKNLIFLSSCLFMYAITYAQTTSISGFVNATAQPQLSVEKQFDQNLSAVNIGNTIKQLSSRPHHIGSAGGKSVADSIYNKFKSYGWDVRIDTYHVLFPTPKTRLLEMTAPSSYKALLKEPALKEDATSDQPGQ